MGFLTGSATGGKKGGGGGGYNPASELGRWQTQVSQNLLTLTEPLRQKTTADMVSVLSGGSPLNLQVLGPAREAIEGSYGTARENVLSKIPARGGQMNSLLTDVETSRAQDLGTLESDWRKSLWNTALQTGWGAPVSSITAPTGGTSTAATLQGQQATAQNQAISGAKTGTGELLGKLAAMGMA